MEQAFLLLKNQNERWDETIREYNDQKFDELMAGFHQRYSPNRSLRLTSAQNTSKYHPSQNMHLARKLANLENTSFRDHNLEMGRGEELPLETIMSREPLGGRFVFPSHAMGLTPRQGSEFVDVPESKRAYPLNLYGFESTPERYGKNQDPEGIIYGDLEEDSVRRLNKNPFMLRDLQRAASMFLPRSKDAPPSRIGLEGTQRNRVRELAQMLMDAKIPGALIDPQTARAYGIKSFQDIVPTKIGPDGKVISSITENLNDLTGNIGGGMDPLHGTFQQWERNMGPSGRVAELDETHTSPEQMQLLDDQLTAIPGALKDPTQFYRSEPMDIAMRLLKRQTNLGEHHQDFPSPYGPVVAYHGTTGDDARKIMGGDGLKTHSDNYRTISTNPSESLSYAIDRSVGHHGTGTHSEPKLLAIRQAAFDQNHPNHIGPSHNFKTAQRQTVDFSDATHYGGNIPRQFLTNTPITNPVLENTAQARTNNQNDINIAMSRPALSTRGQIAQRENAEIDTPKLQQTNQRGEVRPKEPSRLMRWGRNSEQITDDYNQRMAQYMQPNPVVQPTDPNQQQLPLQQPQVQQPQVQQPQVQQPQVQQPQMIQQGEPMDIAMQLLKERVSPEAKRHKLEYDKKYESSPERVKYREDLNRERRRRGIYGSHDHKDISHTEGGKLTLEGEHENRARHFKDKGTLRQVNKAQQTLPSYDEKMVQSLTKPDQSTMYISSRPGRETVSAEEQSAKHDELLAAIAELNKNGQMNLLTGTGKGEWGNEHSIAIQNYPPEIKQQLYELARRYGQDAVAESNAREKGMRFVNPASGEDTFSFGGREIQENPRYGTDFPTGQKISFTE